MVLLHRNENNKNPKSKRKTKLEIAQYWQKFRGTGILLIVNSKAKLYGHF
jgi:hypothetical protein